MFTTITLADACGRSGQGNGPGADRFCNMFQPGVFNPTAQPTYILYATNNKGYNTDFNNLGPILGVAWRPNVQSGWLRALLGDPELATVNGGFTRSFVRTRLDQFLNVYNGNPGQTIPATRSTSTTAFPIVGGRATRACGRFSTARRTASARRRSTQPHVPAAGIDRRRQRHLHHVRQRLELQPEHRGAVDRLLERELPALGHEGHGLRGAVSGQSQVRGVDGRELERHEHLGDELVRIERAR